MKFTEDCSNKVLRDLDIDHKLIDKCINDSFVISGDYQSDNKILAEDALE